MTAPLVLVRGLGGDLDIVLFYSREISIVHFRAKFIVIKD